MWTYKLPQVYIVIIVSIIVILLWIRLVWKFNRRDLFLLILATLFIGLFFLFFFVKRYQIISDVRGCLNTEIEVESFYGKKNVKLVLYENFTYKIFDSGKEVKSGTWDTLDEKCSSIITDTGDRLGFGNLKLKK